MKFTLAAPFQTTSDSVAIAVKAEECGFHGITFGDHLVNFEKLTDRYTWSEDGIPPRDTNTECPEIFTLLSFIAAKTERINLMSSVLVLPMHNP